MEKSYRKDAGFILGVYLRFRRRNALERAWKRAARGRDDADAKAVLMDLRTKTQVWSNSEDGLVETRTELMDSVDRGLVHRALSELNPETAQNVLNQMPELPGSLAGWNG